MNPFVLLRRISLTQWILISLVGGFLVGVYAPGLVPLLKPFRGLFLNGVKCIIAPLIISTIICGIASAESFKTLGKMGIRALIYFEIATTLALVVGLAVVNLLKPGQGVQIGGTLSESAAKAAETKMSGAAFIVVSPPHEHRGRDREGRRAPDRGVRDVAWVRGAFDRRKGEADRPFCGIRRGSDVQVHVLHHAARPFRRGCGDGGERPRTRMASDRAALEARRQLVLGTPHFRGGLRPLSLHGRIQDPVLEVRWPLQGSDHDGVRDDFERIGLPARDPEARGDQVLRRISSFVLPMGYSFNLDGPTLYLAMASVFIAQAAGIDMPMSTQLTMMLTLMLTTKGVAAVPRASLVVLSGTLSSFGLPLEGIALILAVDEFMDMARTGVNLFGNCLATSIIARWEGVELEFPDQATS